MVLLNEVGELCQVPASLLGCGVTPFSLESLAGGGYGDIYILLGSFVDVADNLLGGGVDDLEGLLVNTFDPFVVDEPVGRKRWG